MPRKVSDVADNEKFYVSILSGEMLRLRERYGDLDPEREREGLFDIYLEPAEAGLPLRDLERLLLSLLLLLVSSLLALLPTLLLLLLLLPARTLLSSSSPSIASRRRLFRGPSSPVSSNISLFCIRGMTMSHTRSSVKSW